MQFKKGKIFTILTIVMLVLVIIPFSTNSLSTTSNSQEEETIEVKVAIYSETPIGWDTDAPEDFVPLLKDYQWKVGNKSYKFIITHIYDKDILNGDLNINNYDMVICPGGGVGDGVSVEKGKLANIRPEVIKWKKNFGNFIKNGGGYSGYCGGTALICDFIFASNTF